MTALRLPAPAKLNLFLHVTGRRDDGYHELQTLFQFLDYCDELRFEPAAPGEIRVTGNTAVGPESDLIARAAQRLAAATGCRRGASIRVDKRVPIGGGLGGGSSDAATTLAGLNRLWGLGLDTARLGEIGLTLGADVPVFVAGRAAWAEGVGERLTPVDGVPEPWYLVIKPPVSISTAEVFSAPELTRNGAKITIADFLSGRGGNHLQPVVERRYPEVAEALAWLAEFAPARMTGSGACVFAAFSERRQALTLLERLSLEWTGFVARGRNRSPLLDALDRLS